MKRQWSFAIFSLWDSFETRQVWPNSCSSWRLFCYGKILELITSHFHTLQNLISTLHFSYSSHSCFWCWRKKKKDLLTFMREHIFVSTRLMRNFLVFVTCVLAAEWNQLTPHPKSSALTPALHNSVLPASSVPAAFSCEPWVGCQQS